MCSHSKRQYFYSVYTNSRICRFCWTEAEEEPMATPNEEALGSLLRTMAKAAEDNTEEEECTASPTPSPAPPGQQELSLDWAA